MYERAKKKSMGRSEACERKKSPESSKKCCAHLSSYLIGATKHHRFTGPSGMRIAVSWLTFSRSAVGTLSLSPPPSFFIIARPPSRSAECPVPASIPKQIASFTYIIFAFLLVACDQHDCETRNSQMCVSPAPLPARETHQIMYYKCASIFPFEFFCFFSCWRCPPAPPARAERRRFLFPWTFRFSFFRLGIGPLLPTVLECLS